MSKRTSVYPDRRICEDISSRPSGSVAKAGLLLLSALLIVFIPALAECGEMLIAEVFLNSQNKGEFFVIRSDGGDFLLKESDIAALGIKEPKGRITVFEGEQYISLGSMEGVSFEFNETALALSITAAPELLPATSRDFTFERPAYLYRPRDDSAFLNYGLSYSDGDSYDTESVTVNGELGIRRGNFLFITDSSYTGYAGDSTFIRYMSSLIYETGGDLNRLVVGDFVTSGGDFSNSLNMGGVSYSTVYKKDPYMISYPLLDFKGFASLPSEVEVYIDDTLIYREKVAPGEFNFNNISYYSGSHMTKLVIRDPYGRETVITNPFYFTTRLLRKGLREFSYNLGLIRINYGTEDDEYDEPAFSALYREGVSSALTLGVRAEGSQDVQTLTPQGTYLLGHLGTAALALSGSHAAKDSEDAGGPEGWGGAGMFDYAYNARYVSFRLNLKAFSEDYAMLSSEEADSRPETSVSAGVNFASRRMGSVSLGVDLASYYDAEDSRKITAAYSRTLPRNINLSIRSTTDLEGEEDEIFAALTYSFRKGHYLSASYSGGEDSDLEQVQVSKNAPLGRGWGYRVNVDRQEDQSAGSSGEYFFNPSVQFNSNLGTYRADYTSIDGGEDAYNVSAAGALAYVAGTVGATRPIRDSFGLVRVKGLKDISVLVNSQNVGRTNAVGEAFVPELSSYNVASVAIDDGDIPMDYILENVSRKVSVPLRSGSLFDFDIRKFIAVTGMLTVVTDSGPVPAAFYEMRVSDGEKEFLFPTGSSGEIYVENLDPGTYRASIIYRGEKCAFDMVITESEEMFTDIGEVFCTPGAPEAVAPVEPEPPAVETEAPIETETEAPATPETLTPETAEPEAAPETPVEPEAESVEPVEPETTIEVPSLDIDMPALPVAPAIVPIVPYIAPVTPVMPPIMPEAPAMPEAPGAAAPVEPEIETEPIAAPETLSSEIVEPEALEIKEEPAGAEELPETTTPEVKVPEAEQGTPLLMEEAPALIEAPVPAEMPEPAEPVEHETPVEIEAPTETETETESPPVHEAPVEPEAESVAPEGQETPLEAPAMGIEVPELPVAPTILPIAPEIAPLISPPVMPEAPAIPEAPEVAPPVEPEIESGPIAEPDSREPETQGPPEANTEPVEQETPPSPEEAPGFDIEAPTPATQPLMPESPDIHEAPGAVAPDEFDNPVTEIVETVEPETPVTDQETPAMKPDAPSKMEASISQEPAKPLKIRKPASANLHKRRPFRLGSSREEEAQEGILLELWCALACGDFVENWKTGVRKMKREAGLPAAARHPDMEIRTPKTGVEAGP